MSMPEEVGTTYRIPIDSLIRCLPITLLEAHCLRAAYGKQRQRHTNTLDRRSPDSAALVGMK